ncbi:unnamed protein product [Ceratitis capitata]|uniref:(Mediterranean fruit fly) hypothetical protein n=1 Tax=Ceratitis capitata TaxID=7213 RepID=A0A811V6H1_CERCA|nr:unnamed protein product [Ceratitis capitata]
MFYLAGCPFGVQSINANASNIIITNIATRPGAAPRNATTTLWITSLRLTILFERLIRATALQVAKCHHGISVAAVCCKLRMSHHNVYNGGYNDDYELTLTGKCNIRRQRCVCALE